MHREIKPANFVMVDGPEAHTVYILDIGLCRPLHNEDGVLLRLRGRPGFQGTLLYAPVCAHLCEEQGRKDDLEAWLYMVSVMLSGPLPWEEMACQQFPDQEAMKAMSTMLIDEKREALAYLVPAALLTTSSPVNPSGHGVRLLRYKVLLR